jgi:hypothetical protein
LTTTIRSPCRRRRSLTALRSSVRLSRVAPLRELYLFYNGIGNDGARALADALRHTAAPLRELHLASNNIGDDGARALADALRHTAAPLTRLNLSCNGIGDDGARALADALRHTAAPLRELVLSYNHIGPDGAAALVSSLEDGNAWALDRAELRFLFRKIGAHASSLLRRFAQPGNRSLRTVTGSFSDTAHGARIRQLLAERENWSQMRTRPKN